MDYQTLISVIIVAFLSFIGNILFFKYQFKKQNKWKISEQQLTELLLPLFYACKEYQLKSIAWSSNGDTYNPSEDISGEPKELVKEITPIIKAKLHLADDDFHLLCIKFLEWASAFNEEKAYQNIQSYESVNLEMLDEFKKQIEKNYYAARNTYLTRRFF